MRELCLGGLLVLVTGCVPNGPASTSQEAGASAATGAAHQPSKSPPPAVARPTGSAAPSAPSPPLGAGFEDNFERASPGSDWILTGADWRINSGRLCGREIGRAHV